MTNDRQTLINRLQAASARTKLEHYVFETIRLALRDQQISPSTALTWLREKELVGQIEERR